MQINRLETHDRLQEFNKQSKDVSECCQNLINKRPFGSYPFYIYAHGRTVDLDEKIGILNDDIQENIINGTPRRFKNLSEVPEKRIIWQPRLSRPKPQTNSMLFKAYPKEDLVKIIWIIPARELWEQYQKGNITENATVLQSIHDFVNNRELLEKNEEDDLSDIEIDSIYRDLSVEAKYKKNMSNLWLSKLNG